MSGGAKHLGDAQRISALRQRFEQTKLPPAPVRERVRSAVDGPRRAIAVDALRAQDESKARIQKQVKNKRQKRDVPVVRASDSDEMRKLKKEIIGKEQEIQAMARKMNEINLRLGRLVSMLYASQIPEASTADTASPSGTNKEQPARAATPKYSKLLSQLK